MPDAALSTSPSPSTTANAFEVAVERDQLLVEVQASTRVTETKATVPILTHLLLRATDASTLSITGSNLRFVVWKLPGELTHR